MPYHCQFLPSSSSSPPTSALFRELYVPLASSSAKASASSIHSLSPLSVSLSGSRCLSRAPNPGAAAVIQPALVTPPPRGPPPKNPKTKTPQEAPTPHKKTKAPDRWIQPQPKQTQLRPSLLHRQTAFETALSPEQEQM